MVHVMQIEIRHTTYKRDCLYNVSAYSLNEMHTFIFVCNWMLLTLVNKRPQN